MQYVFSLPTSPSFTNKGLVGYDFAPLNEKDVEVFYVESEKGHDTFIIRKKVCGSIILSLEPVISR